MSKEVVGTFMKMVRSRDVVQAEGSARTEGARRATGVRADGAAAGPGSLAPGQRWSASRKRDVVLRLLRGESLEALSREVGVEIYRLAWNVRIAEPGKGYNNSSGPLAVRGTLIQGLGGCDRYKDTGCFVSAYDPATGRQLWKFHTVAPGRAGRRHVGTSSLREACGGRHVDHRQLRSRAQPDVLGRRAGEAVVCG